MSQAASYFDPRPFGPEDLFANPAQLAPPRVHCESRADGSLVLRSPEPMGPYARCIGQWLEHWAAATPHAPAFAERQADGGWRALTWGETRAQVGRVAQALLSMDLAPGAPEAPVVILSDNAIDHLLLMLAAMHIGRPVCSVSSAYSRPGSDFARLHAILQALKPALVYAADAEAAGPALKGATIEAPRVFSRQATQADGACHFAQLLATDETPAVHQAFEAIAPDATAKYLLTSGSTGQPKVVINTHRMLCANQQMLAQTLRFLAHEKPVLVDWLPWSHTFGGNHNLNMVLCHGGRMVIDEGRPAPGLVEKTLRNLAEVGPTLHFNVPRGLDMLLPLLEADASAAAAFLRRLRAVFYAGAALTPATWQRLQKLARRVRGAPLWLTTSWGSTETSPAVTTAHWKLDEPGVIGLPLPGLELKLVPAGGKQEMRVRGVSVFPGYRDAPELTAAAFDDEGYYRIGDAGRLAEPEHPERGVVFDGRVAEDFKLGSGTWVSVGTLRVRWLSALAPLAQDVVVTGHGRDELGMLVFPSAAAAEMPADALATRVAEVLRTLGDEAQGSSERPARALLLDEPPSAAAGEITDKGYLNQAAVLARRADDVQALYGNDARVIKP